LEKAYMLSSHNRKRSDNKINAVANKRVNKNTATTSYSAKERSHTGEGDSTTNLTLHNDLDMQRISKALNNLE